MYPKTAWEDRVLDPTNQTVITEGTKVTATRLNKIEGGIEGAHVLVEQIAQIVGNSFVAAPTGTPGLAFSTSGLMASWTAGVAYVAGVRIEVVGGSIQLNATQGQYLYLDSDGAVKNTTSQSTADAKCPLWYFATDASQAVTSTDRRKIITNLFQSVADGKSQVAAAISGKGGTVAGTAPYTFQQLTDGVGSIKRGTGNALPADVLATKTFSNDSGPGLTGTMTNNGKWNATPGAAAITIPKGYHDGTGAVAAVAVPAANVLTGTTIAGTAGTMPNQGAKTWTPTTADQVVPAGYYAASTVKGDANLVAENVLSGKSIFGVAGNVIAGKRFATGSVTGNSAAMITVSGLAFQPVAVIIMTGTTSMVSTTNQGSLTQLIIDPNMLGPVGGGYSSGGNWYRSNSMSAWANNTGSSSSGNTMVSITTANGVYPIVSTAPNNEGITANGFYFTPHYVTTQTYQWIAYGQ